MQIFQCDVTKPTPDFLAHILLKKKGFSLPGNHYTFLL